MKNYRLCGLSQGNTRTQGWIEERGAKVGYSVEIKELGGFWEVIGVGDTVMTAEEITNRRNATESNFLSIK